MTLRITLYSRKECCLCDDMKKIVAQVISGTATKAQEIDVDSSPDLQRQFGGEVPVLFINGRKAFKYRVEARELKERLEKELRRGS
jgi:glutaredoxin